MTRGIHVASAQEQFWVQSTFAFVGHSAKMRFPRISYGEVKKRAKRVFAVDSSIDQIDGDRTFADLGSLPEKVDGLVIEVPPEETLSWIQRAVAAGVRNVWIHAGCETPEALALARQEGLNVLTGHCAVMYLAQGFSPHAVHRWFTNLAGRY
jgi:uncharacterized protein